MSRRYFFDPQRSPSCSLCARGAPTLLHLFTDCSATRAVCNKCHLPMDASFLRIFLLQRTGRELVALIDGIDLVLSSLTRASLANPTIVAPLAIAPDVVTIDTRDFLIRFDGSYMADIGSGIGVTLGYRDSLTHIATFSVPTASRDA